METPKNLSLANGSTVILDQTNVNLAPDKVVIPKITSVIVEKPVMGELESRTLDISTQIKTVLISEISQKIRLLKNSEIEEYKNIENLKLLREIHYDCMLNDDSSDSQPVYTYQTTSRFVKMKNGDKFITKATEIPGNSDYNGKGWNLEENDSNAVVFEIFELFVASGTSTGKFGLKCTYPTTLQTKWLVFCDFITSSKPGGLLNYEWYSMESNTGFFNSSALL